MKDIVIIGAGGFGREIAWMIEEINSVNKTWNLLGFVDDNDDIKGTIINGYKVLGNLEWLRKQSLNAVIAIGNPLTRKKIVKVLERMKIEFPSLMHPSVIKSNSVEIGEGSIICAGSILTTNINIGNHAIINLDCTIGHDSNIGNYSTLSPSVNVSGKVIIGENVSIGSGSVIIEGISICSYVILGAGAIVTRNIITPGVYVGIPAKKSRNI